MENYDLMVPVVPSSSGAELSIPLQRILVAEHRAEEISFITPGKAPELLTIFNRAYLDASDAYSKLRYERDRAEDEVAKIKAEILLDRVPDILKAKNIASSADVRQAIIDSDPDYRNARERVSFIEASLEYVKGKMKFLENSYTSIKKIMDTNNWGMQYKGTSKQLDGMLDETAPVGGQVKNNFGNPK